MRRLGPVVLEYFGARFGTFETALNGTLFPVELDLVHGLAANGDVRLVVSAAPPGPDLILDK